MWNISDYYILPLDDWIQHFVTNWLVPHFRPSVRMLQWPVQSVLAGLNGFLQSLPFPLFLGGATAIAWRAAGRNVAWLTAFAVVAIDVLGLWSEAMTTWRPGFMRPRRN